jgi:hypothetical protein
MVEKFMAAKNGGDSGDYGMFPGWVEKTMTCARKAAKASVGILYTVASASVLFLSPWR